MKSKPLVSIVMPVYEAESFLEKSVYSIINQTYPNIEIILVDDGSKDSSGLICDELARIDNRIIVRHKLNGGVSSARNLGLDNASGDFVTFVDSDDIIALNMLELMVRNIKDSDIFVSGYEQLNEYHNFQFDKNVDLVQVDSKTCLIEMLYQKSVPNAPFSKLFKKDLVKELRFDEDIRFAEDLLFNTLAIQKANKITVSSAKLYGYIFRKGSAINSKFNMKRLDGLKSTLKVINLFDDSEIRKAAVNRYFAELLFIMASMKHHKVNKDEFRALELIFVNVRDDVISDPKSRLSYRIYALISYLGVSNFLRIYKFKNYIMRILS